MSARQQFDTTRAAAGSSKNVRGLPQPEDLKSLAMTYLMEQGKHWPELVGSHLLMAATDDAALELASEFTRRNTCDAHERAPARVSASQCKEVGAAYVRYSDANSNARSLDQQLVKILATASRQRIFVPWSFVFADAAISGTLAARPGYQMLVKAIEAKGTVTVAIVDELDRLFRDQEHAARFHKLLSRFGKRLITSNGFDSTSSDAKVTYTISSLTSDLYIDQLKLKVDRGMTDSVKQGRHVSAPPLGYCLKPRLDEQGQPVLGPNRKLISDVVIDPERADVVRRVFELYSKGKQSPKSIARLFNQEAVLGRSDWNTSGVANLLTHELYIGKQIWNKTGNYVDSETGRRTTTRKPVEEWIEVPALDLRIVSDELWEAVRARKKEVARKPRKPGEAPKSRQSQYPTRLFDLYCHDCQKPLQTYRSGEYPQLKCPNQSEGRMGCSLKVSKSQMQIDECILAELSHRLLCEDDLEAMVASANEFLEKEAAKPPVDIAAIDSQIRKVIDKIKRSTERLIALESGPAADLVVDRIKADEALLDELRLQRRQGTEENFCPEPLTVKILRSLVNHLRLLLQEGVLESHSVLAKALGQVFVRIGPKRGKRYSWIAELQIDPLPVMVEIAARKNCPSTTTLESPRSFGTHETCQWVASARN